MNKKQCKNIDLIVEKLVTFIFERTNEIISDLESNEKFKEVAEKFNKLPRLKRLFDLCIMNFWVVSSVLELYYEHDDFEKICEKVEIGVGKSLHTYAEKNKIMGVVLKDFIKDDEEKALLIRNISSELEALNISNPIGDDTKLSLNTIYEIVHPKRFVDYNSIYLLPNPSVGKMRLSFYFGQHIFGKKASEEYDVVVLGTIFTLINSITNIECSKVINYQEGIIAFEQGDYDAAISAFEIVLEFNNVFARENVHNINLDVDNKTSLDTHYYLSLAYVRKGDNTNASKQVFILGVGYGKLGQHEKAISYFEKAIEFNPNYAEAYLCIGAAYCQLEQPKKAIKYLEKVIKLDPNLGLAYHTLGSAYCQLRQDKKAITYLEKAIELNLNFAGDYYNLGSAYYGLRQYEKAITYFEKAIKLDPNCAESYNALGVAYNKLRQPQKAITYFEKAIEVNPNYAGAYYNLGIAYNGLRQYEKARTYFEKSKILKGKQ